MLFPPKKELKPFFFDLVDEGAAAVVVDDEEDEDESLDDPPLTNRVTDERRPGDCIAATLGFFVMPSGGSVEVVASLLASNFSRTF